MIDPKTKYVCIVGPTASSKTELAIRLAERFNGEIVCADSRTIYKGMDIGTAKPTVEEQERVPHHLLDLIEPDQVLSAAEFKRLAEEAISDIADRGKVPFLVGGSGLYAYGVIYDYQFPAGPANDLRSELQHIKLPALVERLQGEDPEAAEAIDLQNRRRVIRALETVGQPRQKAQHLSPNILLLGIDPDKEVTQQRIEQRVEKMLEEGFLEEVKRVGEKYGWDAPAFSAIGYRAFRGAVLGEKTVEEAAADFVHGDIILAKKQRTWFARNQEIQWLSGQQEAESSVAAFLNPSS